MRIYSTGTDPIQAVEGDTEPTQKVDVDGTFDDLDVASIDALVVPGGTVNADTHPHRREGPGDRPRRHRGRQAARGDLPRPVAARLRRPGQGQAADQLPQPRRRRANAGGDWVDEEVVVDGNLITSRNPGDLPPSSRPSRTRSPELAHDADAGPGHRSGDRALVVRRDGVSRRGPAASGPSVASSSCLTSRKTQTTSEASRIITEPTRNACVAPSVKVAWKPARLDEAQRVPGIVLAGSMPAPWAACASVGADLVGPGVGEVQRHRAQRGQPERAADLLHGVEHARSRCRSPRPARGAPRSGSAARRSGPCRPTSSR